VLTEVNISVVGFPGEFLDTRLAACRSIRQLEGKIVRKQGLVERFGKLPPGMSEADVQVILEFLYGAFDKRSAKQVEIFHPYAEDGAASLLTISDFCRWLREAAA